MADDAQVETTDAEDATEEINDDAETVDEDPNANLKKALNAERKARRDAEKRARELEAEKDAAGKTQDERAIDEARREAAAEATKTANQRLLRAEIRAAAKGRLADAADALAYLDLNEFEVGDDGEIDSESIENAISDLLTRKPYLAGDSKKFGSADQGAKGRQTKPSQLSKDDLDKMSPEQIVEARKSGRLDALLGVKH